MKQIDVERIEVDLLLEALYRRYGYDFRSYARASVDRRIHQLVGKKNLETISELIPLCLHDREVFSEIAQQFSISVTELFRDPPVYRAIREKVLPYLKSFSYLKVWHAGCATGEEVYSLAILLKESGLLGRSTIFGTDFNDNAIARAREGIYGLDRIREATDGYQKAGGEQSFSDYYHAQYDSAVMNPELKEHITFANHNLATDQVFGEMHFVFCRNVMIYFNRELQNRVLKIFTDSLVRGGFLCLGTKEQLQFSEVADCYEAIDRAGSLYQRKA